MSRTEKRTGRERRAEPRYRINEPAVLKTQDGGVAAVRVLDVSVIGLRITAPSPLPPNTSVEIQFEDAKVSGSVRNCRCIRATEFHLGIAAAPPGLEDLRALRRAKLLNGGIAIDRRKPNSQRLPRSA